MHWTGLPDGNTDQIGQKNIQNLSSHRFRTVFRHFVMIAFSWSVQRVAWHNIYVMISAEGAVAWELAGGICWSLLSADAHLLLESLDSRIRSCWRTLAGNGRKQQRIVPAPSYSGRKKAHKHKLLALVNVRMALGQTAGCPRVNRAKKFICVRLETQEIATFPSG